MLVWDIASFILHDSRTSKDAQTDVNLFIRPGKSVKYCDDYVCLSARSHISETTDRNFTKFLCRYCGIMGCCLSPWLTPSLAALWYVMHFRVCGWRHVFTPRAPWCVICIPMRRLQRHSRNQSCSTTKISKYTSWIVHLSKVCYLRLPCCTRHTYVAWMQKFGNKARMRVIIALQWWN